MVRAWFQFSPLVNVIISLCGTIAENNYKEKGLQILLYILNSNLPCHHPNTATIASLALNCRLLTLAPPPFFPSQPSAVLSCCSSQQTALSVSPPPTTGLPSKPRKHVIISSTGVPPSPHLSLFLHPSSMLLRP